MKKNVCLTLLAGVLYVGAMAQSVDVNTAKKIAANYCHQMKGEKNFTVCESYAQQQNGKTVYYIINFKEGGFAIVSADEKANPVIAYSTENQFDLQMKNPALKSWMNARANEIEAIMQTNVPANTKVQQDWENLKSGKPMFKQKADDAIEPLLTCTWNQDKFYNTNCPADDNSNGEEGMIAGTAAYDNHVPVGCVALATAQIMYYHRYPKTGIGSSSYSSPYGKLSANYGKTYYNYNNMSDIAKNYSNDLAQLINHVGIAVEMVYGADGSSSQTQKIVSALRKNFGYSSSIQYSERVNYTTENWHKLLLNNLKQGLPMVYSGNPQAGGAGHAFNCDGYDGNGKFHMNWGWAGNSNGYYDIDNMTQVGGYDFSDGHEIVCNIKPQSSTIKTQDTLTGTYGSFGRGNAYNKYEANEQLSWYICPPNANSITLNCSRFETDTNDIVSIYSAPGDTTPLAVYSGNYIKGKSILVNGSTAYITFTSQNESKGGSGFLFTYTTTLNDLKYCLFVDGGIISNTYKITETSGTITNGSNGENYANSNECYWRIEPKNATAIWVSFDTFDLAEGDVLYLYNYDAKKFNPSVISGLSNVIATYTKANPPEIGKIIELEKNGLYLYFRTDNDKSASGWAFKYDINVGIETHNAGIAAYQVFPNPATDQLNVRISFNENEGDNAKIRLTDVLGRTIYQNAIQTTENDAELSIATSDFAAGMYILNIQTAKGSVSKKIQIVK